MAMDKRGALFVHPSFPAIIKEMHPDEALLLGLFTNPDVSFPVITLRREVGAETNGIDIVKNFSHLGKRAGCDQDRVFLTPSYLDNLQRFHFVVVPDGLNYP